MNKGAIMKVGNANLPSVQTVTAPGPGRVDGRTGKLARFLLRIGQNNLQPTAPVRRSLPFGQRFRLGLMRVLTALLPSRPACSLQVRLPEYRPDTDYQCHQGHIAILEMLKLACLDDKQKIRLIHAIAHHQQALFLRKKDYLNEPERRTNYAFSVEQARQTALEVFQSLISNRILLRADNYPCLAFIRRQLETWLGTQQKIQAIDAGLAGYQPGLDAELDAILECQSGKQEVLSATLEQVLKNAQEQWNLISPVLLDIVLPCIYQYLQSFGEEQDSLVAQLQGSFLDAYIEVLHEPVFQLLLRHPVSFDDLDHEAFKSRFLAYLSHERNNPEPGALACALLASFTTLSECLNAVTVRSVLRVSISAACQHALQLLQEFPLALTPLVYRFGARRSMLDLLDKSILVKEEKISHKPWWTLIPYDPFGHDGRKVDLMISGRDKLSAISLFDDFFEKKFSDIWVTLCQDYYDLGLVNSGSVLQLLSNATISNQLYLLYRERAVLMEKRFIKE